MSARARVHACVRACVRACVCVCVCVCVNKQIRAFHELSTVSSTLSDKKNDPLLFVCLFDLILYVQSTIFQLYRDGSSWVEPVLS